MSSFPTPLFHFAPLEGYTDVLYRSFLFEHYPCWDFYWTDFLRLPTESKLKPKQIIDHIGNHIFKSEELLFQTVLQILTSQRSADIDHFKTIEDLEIPWLDLNFGCPSKKVMKNGGGAKLLDSPKEIASIVRTARKNFSRTLSAKIRIGVQDDSNFEEIIHILNEEGIDLITLHPRTAVQMYTGKSDWSYFEKIKALTHRPIIANGDVLNDEDIRIINEDFDLHQIMIGRKALGKPWIVDPSLKETAVGYLKKLIEWCQNHGLDDHKILCKMKSFCHYADLDQDLKRSLLHSNDLETIQTLLK